MYKHYYHFVSHYLTQARDVNGWAPNDYLLLTASTEMVSSGENGSITAQSSKNGNNSSSTGDRAEADTDGALQEEMEEKVEKSSEAWHSNGGWPQESLPYSRGSNYEKCDIDVVKGKKRGQLSAETILWFKVMMRYTNKESRQKCIPSMVLFPSLTIDFSV